MHYLSQNDPNPIDRARELRVAQGRYFFDYDRFPPFAMQDEAGGIPAAALFERPKWLLMLVGRILELIEHFIALLTTGGGKPAPEPSVSDLQVLQARMTESAQTLSDLLAANDPRDAQRIGKLLRSLATDFVLAQDALSVQALNQGEELPRRGLQQRTLETYTSLFTHGTIPPPAIHKFFADDEIAGADDAFASWFLRGNNPLVLRRVLDGDLERAGIELDPEQYAGVVPGDSPERALAAGRLYWVHFPDLLGDLDVSDFPTVRYLPLPTVVLATPPKPTDPDEAQRWAHHPPKLVAIRADVPKQGIEQEGVLYPPGSGGRGVGRWRVARNAALQANQIHHILVSHFPRTHFPMEAMYVSTRRHIGERHPLRALLEAHLEGILAINSTAISSFLSEAGSYRFLLASTMRTGIRKLLASFEQPWSDGVLPADLSARGVDDPELLPYYPYRDDGRLLLAAIEDLVRDYLAEWYASDADVAEDHELQAWAAELSTNRERNGAGLTGFDPPQTVAELRELLVGIIFNVTGHHAAIQFPLNEFDFFAPSAPGAALQDPGDPSTDNVAATLPSLALALYQLAFNYFGDVLVTKVGDYDKKSFDQSVEPVLDAFGEALKDIEKQIKVANDLRGEDFAYPYLLPSQVPQSVDI